MTTETFPLPTGHAHSFHVCNGQALAYQAQEVRRCLEKGLTESPLMTLDESVLVAELAQEINKMIGVSFDGVTAQE